MTMVHLSSNDCARGSQEMQRIRGFQFAAFKSAERPGYGFVIRARKSHLILLVEWADQEAWRKIAK